MEKTQDPGYQKIFSTDWMTPIGSNGQTLHDITEGGEPAPDESDMLSVEEVAMLWVYLPEERRKELEPHINKLWGSIRERPDDFNGWQKMMNASLYHSFERQLAQLMMATMARTYREWLVICLSAGDNQVKLKRVAAAKLRELASMPSEISVAKRKYDEAFR